MKKGVLYLSLILVLVMISVSFVSASWFSEVYNKITGNAVSSVCPIGLVGYWKFDGNFDDSSGNGNNCFCSGSSCPMSVAGKLGEAYSFDGANDYMDVGKDVIGTGAVSICAWIYPVGWGGNNRGRIVNNGRAWLYVNNGNAPGKALSFTSDGVHYSASSLNSIKLNEWNFVCFTRNVRGTPVYYINGVLSPLGINGGGSPAAAITNTIIGGRQTASDKGFNGTIDEVMVYSRELSSQEITLLYNSGNGKDDVCGAITPTLPQGTQSTTATPVSTVPTCTENWNCTSWSACSSNAQIRTCRDVNNCGTVANKPTLTQACSFISTTTCTDSDGGITYDLRGVASGIKLGADYLETYEDICITGDEEGRDLKEGFCTNNRVSFGFYECPNGCLDGKCLNVTSLTVTCTDSDGGLNPNTFGAIEVKMGSFESKHEDACALILSYDSNGVPGGWHGADDCSGENCYVEEAFCRTDESGNFIDADADELIKCEHGCLNGACLLETGLLETGLQGSEIPGLEKVGVADPSVLLNRYSFNCSETSLLGYAGGDAGGFSRSVSNGNDVWGFLIYGRPSFNSNSVYIEQGGIVGNSLVFKGETKKTYQNYMSASPFSGVGGKIDEAAVSFWIKTSSIKGVIFSSDYPTNSLMDNTKNSGQSKLIVRNPGSLEIFLQNKNYKTGISLSDNAWHNVIVSFNFSSKSMNIFKDGVLVSSIPVSLMKTSFTDFYVYPEKKITGEFFISPGILGFGDEVVFNSRTWAWSLKHKSPFKGMLDEVAIFFKSLSPEDAGRIYSKGISGQALCSFSENSLSKNCSKTGTNGVNFKGINYPTPYCADNKTLINLQCGPDGLNWNSSRCDKCLGSGNGLCLIIDNSRNCTLLASTLKSGSGCGAANTLGQRRIVTKYTSFKVPESCKTEGCLLRIDSYRRIFNNSFSSTKGKLEKIEAVYYEFKQTGQNWEANILGDSKKVYGKNGDSNYSRISSLTYPSINLYDDAKEKKSDYLSIVDNGCGSAEVEVLLCE